jgi:uncharacterized protein involved in cysteine biosynthesis
MLKILARLARPLGSLVFGLLTAYLTSSDAGLIAAPILRGVSEGLHEYYKRKNEPMPYWVTVIPF